MRIGGGSGMFGAEGRVPVLYVLYSVQYFVRPRQTDGNGDRYALAMPRLPAGLLRQRDDDDQKRQGKPDPSLRRDY